MKKIVLLLISIFVFATFSYAGQLKDYKVTTEQIKQMEQQLAVIEMASGGTITMKFYPGDAPNTVANFINLASKGYYDGLKFHRVVKGFVAQGGDPKGNGTGGPGYSIKAEFNKRPHINGAVAMARSRHPDSAGSQFYICLGPQHFLDGNYTVFGIVTSGMNIVEKIKIGDVMKSIKIITPNKRSKNKNVNNGKK